MTEQVTPEAPTAQTPQTIQPNGLVGNFNFTELAAQADTHVRGFRLVKASALEGVPFAIVGIHVRDGIPSNGNPQNMLSVECVTGDEVTLSRLIAQSAISQGGQIVTSLDALKVRPNECVVFNDGSTGVARQLVSFLHMKGLINIGDTSVPNGPAGESSFDRYRGDWISGGGDPSDENAPDPAYFGSPLLLCMRGLRPSEYRSEVTGTDAVTWYLG